jgi:hypothetical protein
MRASSQSIQQGKRGRELGDSDGIDDDDDDGVFTTHNSAADGYEIEDYLDDVEPPLVTAATDNPTDLNRINNLLEEFLPVFSHQVRASEAGVSAICLCKGDLDSISVTSSSLLKVVYRLCKADSSFQVKTKIYVTNVDKSSRLTIKCKNTRAAGVQNFNPCNRSGTGRQKDIPLRNFKNTLLGEIRIGSLCKCSM